VDATPPKPDGPRGVRVLLVAATGGVVMGLSAALAWALHSGPGRPSDRPSTSAAVADRGDALARAGRLAYQVHCARCHGPEGRGDGPDAERLQPPPRDFASGTWKVGPTAAAIRKVIVEGLPGSAMPGWGESLSRVELDGLASHVLALASRPRPDLAAMLRRAGFAPDESSSPAPPLSLRDTAGDRISLDQMRGRVVLVLFWGTSCTHCVAEMPAMERFADRYRDRGLAVLPACVDETDVATVRAAAGGRPVYLDPSGSARIAYDVQALPTFALIGRDGRLLGTAQGARDWEDPALDDLIRACLESAAGG
jgi:mono/diheme cytochrome c family protein